MASESISTSALPPLPETPGKDLFTSEEEDYTVMDVGFLESRETTETPQKKAKKSGHIQLQEATNLQVRHHRDTLLRKGRAVQELQKELKTLERAIATSTVPRHLSLRRQPPRLPGFLSYSEEFQTTWNGIFSRVESRLLEAWRDEIGRHALSEKRKLDQAEKEARDNIARYPDGSEGNLLLTKLLTATTSKESSRRRKGRRHPYKK